MENTGRSLPVGSGSGSSNNHWNLVMEQRTTQPGFTCEMT